MILTQKWHFKPLFYFYQELDTHLSCWSYFCQFSYIVINLFSKMVVSSPLNSYASTSQACTMCNYRSSNLYFLLHSTTTLWNYFNHIIYSRPMCDSKYSNRVGIHTLKIIITTLIYDPLKRQSNNNFEQIIKFRSEQTFRSSTVFIFVDTRARQHWQNYDLLKIVLTLSVTWVTN